MLTILFLKYFTLENGMKEKRYEIIKRAEREALERNPQGINAIGGNAPKDNAEVLARREKFEYGIPRSSPVNQNGVQMQNDRKDPSRNERQKTSSYKRGSKS